MWNVAKEQFCVCIYIFLSLRMYGGQITKDGVEMLFDRIQSFQCRQDCICCSKYVVESSQDDIHNVQVVLLIMCKIRKCAELLKCPLLNYKA